MAETKLQRNLSLDKKVDNFLFNWYSFPIDYWWRKKYNIPFGSKKHREINFIDMYIEYHEEMSMNKILHKRDEEENEEENEAIGIKDSVDKKVVKLSTEEIDKDFDDLDLSQFD